MILVVMGVAGCGKTTVGRLLAQTLSWRFVEGDDYHPQANRQKMASGTPLGDADRGPWLDRLGDELRQASTRGEHLVLACSALKSSYRQRLRQAGAGRREADVRFIFLEGPAELIARRLAARAQHFMPPSLLQSQLLTLEQPRDALRVDLQLAPAEQVAVICRALGLQER